MYKTRNIFPFLPIKHFISQYSKQNTAHKLRNGMKSSVSNIGVLCFPCVVQKVTAQVEVNSLNMHHQSQKGF